MKAILLLPGLTDAELETACARSHQQVNQACRQLVQAGLLTRVPNPHKNGRLGNYPSAVPPVEKNAPKSPHPDSPLEEDDVKRLLSLWLEADGWSVSSVAWGKRHGVDIEAIRGNERWLIEVKGTGSREAMRHNYFLSILGETLQRMDDPTARYSIAFPEHKAFRGLWERLPALAKERTGISMLLVGETGTVSQLN